MFIYIVMSRKQKETTRKNAKRKVGTTKRDRDHLATRRSSRDKRAKAVKKSANEFVDCNDNITDFCVSSDGKSIYYKSATYKRKDPEIGSGGNGTIYKYTSSDKPPLVVKEFTDDAEFNSEVAASKLLGGDKSVIQTYYNYSNKLIIMPLLKGTLHDKQNLPQQIKFKFFTAVVNNIIRLLENDIIYTDLKCENIMYIGSHVKLIDVGGIFKDETEHKCSFTYPHRGIDENGNPGISYPFVDTENGKSCWQTPSFSEHFLQQIVSLHQVFVMDKDGDRYVYRTKDTQVHGDFDFLEYNYFKNADGSSKFDNKQSIIEELKRYIGEINYINTLYPEKTQKKLPPLPTNIGKKKGNEGFFTVLQGYYNGFFVYKRQKSSKLVH